MCDTPVCHGAPSGQHIWPVEQILVKFCQVDSTADWVLSSVASQARGTG